VTRAAAICAAIATVAALHLGAEATAGRCGSSSPARDTAGTATLANSGEDAEARVVNYIREHLQPGEPLVVSTLYSDVFKQPQERQALSKLYSAFFRIPLFLVQYQEKYGSPPNLKTISQQFDLKVAGEADVLLRVMESDPRVPRFFARDPKTGEIARVDVAAVRSDPRFQQGVERQLGGWEGKSAPDFRLTALDGSAVDSSALRGKIVLLYVWFTGCPPCMQETPALVAVQAGESRRSFAVVGANADELLHLGYDDSVRQRYTRQYRINFAVVKWTAQSDAAYGKISIFPTLFLIDRSGVITHHWVGYVKPEELKRAISALR
jgi:peroxiredoxin